MPKRINTAHIVNNKTHNEAFEETLAESVIIQNSYKHFCLQTCLKNRLFLFKHIPAAAFFKKTLLGYF